MSLNTYRDEVYKFMKDSGFIGESTENIINMLDEEYSLLKYSINDVNKLKHQIYDVFFLLFELAAKYNMDLDYEWKNGRERKKKYSADNVKEVIVYNKLVRDKIPDICIENGKLAVVRELTPQEYEEALAQKLMEECEEYIESRAIEELADIHEVLYAIIENKGNNIIDVEKIRVDKKEKRGGFDKKLLLIETRNR